MGEKFRVAILGTGLFSLLMGTSAFGAQSRLEPFVAKMKGLDAAGRKAAMKALTAADRKALHAEFRALPAAEKAAVNAALGRGKTGGRGSAKLPKNCPDPFPGCTLQYDTGTPHSLRDNWGSVVGNYFNTGFRNPHTIQTVTFQMNGTFGFTPVRMYGAPSGTVAPVLAATTFSGLPIGTLVTWNLPNIVSHNGPFLGGVEQSGSFSTINSAFVGIDIDVNNDGVHGFHGMNINLAGTGFNPNATVGGAPFNAIFRVHGTNLPVELMRFDVH
jgi:hypothetical protein